MGLIVKTTSQGTIYVTDGLSVWYPKWADERNIVLNMPGVQHRESLKYPSEMAEAAIDRMIERINNAPTQDEPRYRVCKRLECTGRIT